MRILIEHGADVNAVDADNNSPLTFSIKRGIQLNEIFIGVKLWINSRSKYQREFRIVRAPTIIQNAHLPLPICEIFRNFRYFVSYWFVIIFWSCQDSSWIISFLGRKRSVELLVQKAANVAGHGGEEALFWAVSKGKILFLAEVKLISSMQIRKSRVVKVYTISSLSNF